MMMGQSTCAELSAQVLDAESVFQNHRDVSDVQPLVAKRRPVRLAPQFTSGVLSLTVDLDCRIGPSRSDPREAK